jgi:hypothetical protein
MAESSTRRILIVLMGRGWSDSQKALAKFDPSINEPTVELLRVLALEYVFNGASNWRPRLGFVALPFKMSSGSDEVLSKVWMFNGGSLARSGDSLLIDTGAGATFEFFDSRATPTIGCDPAGHSTSLSLLKPLALSPVSSSLKIGKSK